MRRVLILYSTVDGHTAHICGRLREGIAQRGYEVTLLNLNDNPGVDLVPYGKVVVGASIRYGRHRPNVIDFMRARRPN